MSTSGIRPSELYLVGRQRGCLQCVLGRRSAEAGTSVSMSPPLPFGKVTSTKQGPWQQKRYVDCITLPRTSASVDSSLALACGPSRTDRTKDRRARLTVKRRAARFVRDQSHAPAASNWAKTFRPCHRLQVDCQAPTQLRHREITILPALCF